MKCIVTLLLVGALAASFGCSKQSTSGGPGTSLPTSEQATVGQTVDTFSLESPRMTTNLTQGESEEITIGINRGKEIDQDVALAFNDLPQGVTVDPMNPMIKHGEKETKVTLKAAADAALGDFTVKLLGQPATGANAATDLKISVDSK